MALPTLPTLFGIGMLAVGLAVTLVSLRYVWRSSALVRADAVSRVDGVAEGSLVRLSGTVDAAGDTLDAPFSGVDCVALRPSVEERRIGAFLLPTYVTIHDPARSRPFAVRTAHATVPVDAPLRTVALDSTVVATVGPGESPPERIGRYERETEGLPRETPYRPPPSILAPVANALSIGARRYAERRASPGDAVTVVGRVADGRIDPLVVADGPPIRTLLRLSKTSLAGLLVGAAGIALGAGLLLAG
ncbi:hypothetical protein [Haloplanus halophilus]|uniref:hypothetical protein n=1 Tax=Haloplanus halophilus TaxID=2949993 RepID=UPI002040E619|nr:hypothetical protein [Haloplanus sp. GDY1]